MDAVSCARTLPPHAQARARLAAGDLPSARLLHNLGMRNGWGYGRSMLGGGGGAAPLLLLDRCVCLAGGTPMPKTTAHLAAAWPISVPMQPPQLAEACVGLPWA